MTVPPIHTDLRRLTRDWEAGATPWTDARSYERPRHRVIRPSLFDRVCGWLETNAAFYAGLIFPLAAAAFALLYFGVRELMGLVL